MVLPHDLCSQIQNAFRARHAKICVNHSTQNLGILTLLLRAGFITSITRGTPTGPNPIEFLHAPSDAQRRIWADLKYRQDKPVLQNMSLVSLPSRRLFMNHGEIRLICSGRRSQTVKPLALGEIAIVRTGSREHEWLEAREALSLKIGGEIICRAM